MAKKLSLINKASDSISKRTEFMEKRDRIMEEIKEAVHVYSVPGTDGVTEDGLACLMDLAVDLSAALARLVALQQNRHASLGILDLDAAAGPSMRPLVRAFTREHTFTAVQARKRARLAGDDRAPCSSQETIRLPSSSQDQLSQEAALPPFGRLASSFSISMHPADSTDPHWDPCTPTAKDGFKGKGKISHSPEVIAAHVAGQYKGNELDNKAATGKP